MAEMTEAEAIYTDRGFGAEAGAGTRPALLVVDLTLGFTDPASPLRCDSQQALAATAELLSAAREGGAPVVYTKVEYDDAGKRAAAGYIAKAPMLARLTRGSRWTEIDEQVAALEGESVIVKLFASAFFGTVLDTLLRAERCDTIVVAGASTSGCVRATVVDGVQHGYRVLVPRSAVADRSGEAHRASLIDLNAKYADVVELATAVSALRGI